MKRTIIVKSFNNPEVEAMLQAFYSRSHTSIVKHLDDLGIPLDDDNNEKELAIKKKLSTYYVGYGHESIADCGTTTIFIENVSIMAAKYIQHTPLYNGQESSTRYISFENKKDDFKELLEHIITTECNALGDEDIIPELLKDTYKLVDELFFLYKDSKEKIVKHLVLANKEKIGKITNIDTNNKRAIEAYAFDIARGLLPSGVLTQLSFHGSLRTIKNHFTALLDNHLLEVREIALEVLSKVYEKYPFAFSDYNKLIKENNNKTGDKDILTRYYLANTSFPRLSSATMANEETNIRLEADTAQVNSYYSDHNASKVSHRNQSNIAGNITLYTALRRDGLDFGSWRDLQRHRNGYISAPFLFLPEDQDGDTYILTDWYRDRLAIYNADIERLNKLEISFFNYYAKYINHFGSNIFILDHIFQYILPMGIPISFIMSNNPDQWDYIFNIRLRETVHNSLVTWLLDVCDIMCTKIPHYNKYFERSKLRDMLFSKKRGGAVITKDGKEI